MPEFLSLYYVVFPGREDQVPDADPSARTAAKAASVDWIWRTFLSLRVPGLRTFGLGSKVQEFRVQGLRFRS